MFELQAVAIEAEARVEPLQNKSYQKAYRRFFGFCVPCQNRRVNEKEQFKVQSSRFKVERDGTPPLLEGDRVGIRIPRFSPSLTSHPTSTKTKIGVIYDTKRQNCAAACQRSR